MLDHPDHFDTATTARRALPGTGFALAGGCGAAGLLAAVLLLVFGAPVWLALLGWLILPPFLLVGALALMPCGNGGHRVSPFFPRMPGRAAHV